MSIAKIEYAEKSALSTNTNITDNHKCTADDMNEIKGVVNNNADELLSRVPVGVINTFAGGSAPLGWLICDGSAISRTTYADLFAVIGTTYGVGDGSTTFNLPNLKGRIPVGYDISDTDFDTIGEIGGEKTHTLTIDEMPAHNHRTGRLTSNLSGNNYSLMSDQTIDGHRYTDNTGGGQAHNNLQPYIVLNYIIKY